MPHLGRASPMIFCDCRWANLVEHGLTIWSIDLRLAGSQGVSWVIVLPFLPLTSSKDTFLQRGELPYCYTPTADHPENTYTLDLSRFTKPYHFTLSCVELDKTCQLLGYSAPQTHMNACQQVGWFSVVVSFTALIAKLVVWYRYDMICTFIYPQTVHKTINETHSNSGNKFLSLFFFLCCNLIDWKDQLAQDVYSCNTIPEHKMVWWVTVASDQSRQSHRYQWWLNILMT